MGAIHIVTSNNDHWELETLHVRVNKHLGSSFTGGVGIRWGENTRLQEVIVIVFHFSVDLVCGYVYEPFDTDLLRALQHNMSTVHVGVCEPVRIAEAQVDMRLRRKMEDGVDLKPFHAIKHFGWVCDISMIKREILLIVEHTSVV